MHEWPLAAGEELPDPDDRTAAWCDGEPAFHRWWRWTMTHESPMSVANANRLCIRYAQAVPGREAIQMLTELGPLVEVGAGEGYWARILLDYGATVDAFDIEPPTSPWAPVGVAGIEVIDRFPGRAVFACWPYRPGYTVELLARARDRTIALITAGIDNTLVDRLGERLRAGWTLRQRIAIPAWPYRGDDLTFWNPRAS